MKNKEIEKLLSCDNCVLKECIQCEISWTERKKIREYIEQLERDFEQVDHECSRLEMIDTEKDLEIKKLNKIIDKMANEIYLSNALDCDFKHFKDNKCKTNEAKKEICKDCIKQYFERKAENENKTNNARITSNKR